MDENRPPPGIYAFDLRNLTYRECWWLFRSPILFLGAALQKMLRIPLESCLHFHPPRISTISPEELPGGVSRVLQGKVEEWKALGFRPVIAERFELPVQRMVPGAEQFSIYLLDGGAEVVAGIFYGKVTSRIFLSREIIYSSCSSELQDGTIVGATPAKQNYLQPPCFQTAFLPGKSNRELLDHHRSRLLNVQPAAVQFNEKSLVDFLQRKMDCLNEYLIDRGVLVFHSPRDDAGVCSRAGELHRALQDTSPVD